MWRCLLQTFDGCPFSLGFLLHHLGVMWSGWEGRLGCLGFVLAACAVFTHLQRDSSVSRPKTVLNSSWLGEGIVARISEVGGNL